MGKTVITVVVAAMVAALLVSAVNAQLNDLPDGAEVVINYGIVSLESYLSPESGYDFFYVQKYDRSSGIRVQSQGYAYEGDAVGIYGYLTTLPSGERQIVVLDGYTYAWYFPLPRPMMLPQRMLKAGLFPSGLYTTIYGRVVKGLTMPDPDSTGYPPASYFYIDDGSALQSDNSEVRGLKVYDPYFQMNLPVALGEFLVLQGVASHVRTPDGRIIPVFFRSTDGYNHVEERDDESHWVRGRVYAAPEDVGKTVRVVCDTAVAISVIENDESGEYSAPYQFLLPEGNYVLAAELLGCPTEVYWIYTYGDLDGIDFYLSRYDPAKVIDIELSAQVVRCRSTTTINGIVTVRDWEGRRYAREPINISCLYAGKLISADTVTDDKGKARFKIRPSSYAEMGIVKVRSGEAVGESYVYFVDPDGPVVWPEEIPEVPVSEDVYIRAHASDYSDPDPEAESSVEAECMKLLEFRMKIDGEIFWRGAAKEDESDPSNPYPLLSGLLETEYYSNGPHEISVEVEDIQGQVFVCAVYSLVFDNEMSEFSVNSNGQYAGEIDLAINERFVISARFKQETHWRVCGYDVDSDAANGLGNEFVVAEGTGVQLNCQWDGRLSGYTSDESRNDLLFIEVQIDTDPGEPTTWAAKKKKQVNIKPFPDSEVQVLLVQGWPVRQGVGDWRNDFVGVFPFRSECLYKRAREKLGKARRLGYSVADWPRVKSILLNGKCRMWYFMGHSRYQGFTTASGMVYTTQIWLTNGLVFSKAVNIGGHSIGVGNLGELNMLENPSLLFAMWDGCNTGQGGGTGLTNPPYVPKTRRNDVAEALGMYSPTPGGRVYIGWRGGASSDATTSDFVGAWDKTAPYTAPSAGVFDLWSRSTGRVLSYVISDYPNGVTCPYILNSANKPQAEWLRIWQNLRVFGSAEGWENNHQCMNERMFSLIP